MNPMKTLITGGSGFIGSHLIDSLLNSGHEIRILDNLDAQVHSGFWKSREDVEFIKGDVTKRDDWLRALDSIEAVYHLGAAVGISQSMHRPLHYLNTNSLGTATFYDVLLNEKKTKERIKKIIVPGSKTVYGEGSYECKSCGVVNPLHRNKEQLESKDWEIRCPKCGEHVSPIGIREDKPINPISVYALSKYDSEVIALSYGFALQIPTVVFRGFSIYGPGQSLSNPYSGVCSIFLSRIKNNKPPVIFEDGKQLRDYVFIKDAVNLLAKALVSRAEGVFNLGTGNPTSVKEIADILIDIKGSQIKPEVTGEYRIGDNRHDFADITKTMDAFGFTPRTSIREGLEQLVEWGEGEKAEDKFGESEGIRRGYFPANK
jgi:dTDP-L-rhamnose 4-epimerase